MPPPVIARTPIIDDDGSLTKGTVFENAWKQQFYDQIDAAIAASFTASGVTYINNANTGTLNDFVVPGRGRDTLVAWAGTGATAIHGIAGGVVGDRITFRNQGAGGLLSFVHQSGTSAVGNKISNPATSAWTPINTGGFVTYVYNGSSWVLVAHDQGAWIVPAFNAAAFTASAGAWTLDAADVVAQSYHLRVKTLSYQFVLGATTITATPVNLHILNSNFGGFLVSNVFHRVGWHNIAGQDVYAFGSSDRISLALLSGGNFPTGTNNAYVYGQWSGEVT